MFVNILLSFLDKTVFYLFLLVVLVWIWFLSVYIWLDFCWILSYFLVPMLYIFSFHLVFTIKSKLKILNLHQIGNNFISNIRNFPQSISKDKIQKYPFPWNVFSLKLEHTKKLVKKPISQVIKKCFPVNTRCLFNVYKTSIKSHDVV